MRLAILLLLAGALPGCAICYKCTLLPEGSADNVEALGDTIMPFMEWFTKQKPGEPLKEE